MSTSGSFGQAGAAGGPDPLDASRARVAGAARDSGLSGVVSVDQGPTPLLRAAYGLADRAHGIAMSPQTQLAVASASKAFTAVAVLALVESGLLALTTPARALLGSDLPEVCDSVTVEHLLAHRSGISDYLDEDAGLDVDAYVMPVPVHELATTEQYLTVLRGRPAKAPPGRVFAYCNSGYVLLALLAERAAGAGFHDLVQRTVCDPAGLSDTGFLRSDALPAGAALGYVVSGAAWRTNVFHLPVRGSGDGGAYSTVEDLHRFWSALFGGRLLRPDTVADMTRRRSGDDSGGRGYGLGIWLDGPAVFVEGRDAGVSCRSVHRPDSGLTWSVLSNTSHGAWPVARALRAWPA